MTGAATAIAGKKRGRRPLLDKEIIVAAALSLIEEQGVAALSLRSIARALDVTPMALYRYFATLEELLSHVFDAFIASRNPLTDAPQDRGWEAWIAHVLASQCASLIENPGWMPHLVSIELGHAASRVLSGVQDYLARYGVSQERAVEIYVSILQVSIGVATLEIQRRGQSDGQTVLRVDQTAAGQKLLISAFREELGSDRPGEDGR